ncbi:MAG: redoxin domain-containing protein [Bacteroidota bacterium]
MKPKYMLTFISRLWMAALALAMLPACQSGEAAQTAAPATTEAVATPTGTILPGDKDHRIEITVKNFTGDKAYLAHYFGTSNRLVDSTAVSNGKVVFEGDQPLDRGMYLLILPPRNTYFDFIVDADQHFSLETDTADFISNMKVDGSEENDVFYGDMHFMGPLQQERTELLTEFRTPETPDARKEAIRTRFTEMDGLVMNHRNEMFQNNPNSFYTKFLQAMMPPQPPAEKPEGAGEFWQWFYIRDHFFDKIDLSDDRMLRSQALGAKVEEYLDKYTLQAPDSIIKSIDLIVNKAKSNDDVFQYVVPTLLNKYGVESKVMGMDAVFVSMVEKYYLSGEAWWADSSMLAEMEERARALSPNLIGRPAPDFVAYGMNGENLSLHGVKGKYTILYFWDYDCGHCKTVTPKLGELYPKYKAMEVALFAVSINGNEEEWKTKVAEYGIGAGINVQDHYRRSGFDGMYDVRSTPRIFLLDKDKVIRYKQISVEQLEEILDRELGLVTDEETETAAGD